jgi:hypothetical protein
MNFKLDIRVPFKMYIYNNKGFFENPIFESGNRFELDELIILLFDCLGIFYFVKLFMLILITINRSILY